MINSVLTLLAGTFFAGVFAYDIERRLKGSLEAQAIRQISPLMTVWNILAILSIFSGWSVFIWGVWHWIWWKVVILFIVAGLAGSFTSAILLYGKPIELRLALERLCHVAVTGVAAWLWYAGYW